jgi:hypothetical protein
MGMSQSIPCPAGVPEWQRVAAWLAERDFPVQIRMIDGQLAFPDEAPSALWGELRVGTTAGMVTVRRLPEGVELTIWGNADPAMQQGWNALALAFAETGGNTEFAKVILAQADLPQEVTNHLR